MATDETVSAEQKTNPENLVEEAQHFVHQYLLNYLPAKYVFHNYDHAEEVAEVCEDLAEQAGLSDKEKEQLQLAAWFHDVGYTQNEDGHERHSAAIARQFLEERAVDEANIRQVEKLIQSTRQEVEPQTELEKILHDANYAFLGRKRFDRRGQLLRMERENVEGREYTAYDWNKKLLDLQMRVKYYTPYAHETFSKRRNKNIAEFKEDMVKARKTTVRKKTGKDFGRGVDTVYRVTLRNHINLSSIADGKANMIISINTLVLSILITAGGAGVSISQLSVQENLKFLLPILVLMVTSLSAIIFAVFSAIPKVSGGEFTDEQVRKHEVSLLYFGNFLKLDKDEFVEYLRDLKQDQEVLYDDLSRDLYNLGMVLRKKYRLLTIAYRLFVGGLALSVVVFLVSFLILSW